VRVREVIRTGTIARWLYKRDWRAVTLPSWRGITIRYWRIGGCPQSYDWCNGKCLTGVDANVRQHEWSLHVAQIRKLGRFRYLYTYAREWLVGYQAARKWMHLSRREAAQFAYDVHVMEQVDWEMNI
jgi:hypothetical protein